MKMGRPRLYWSGFFLSIWKFGDLSKATVVIGYCTASASVPLVPSRVSAVVNKHQLVRASPLVPINLHP